MVKDNSKKRSEKPRRKKREYSGGKEYGSKPVNTAGHRESSTVAPAPRRNRSKDDDKDGSSSINSAVAIPMSVDGTTNIEYSPISDQLARNALRKLAGLGPAVFLHALFQPSEMSPDQDMTEQMMRDFEQSRMHKAATPPAYVSEVYSPPSGKRHDVYIGPQRDPWVPPVMHGPDVLGSPSPADLDGAPSIPRDYPLTVPETNNDLMPLDLPQITPWAGQPVDVTISVTLVQNGAMLRVRPRPTTEKRTQRRRRRESKVHSKAWRRFGALMQIYGQFTEMQDLAEVFVWNLYVQSPSGIRHAMTVTDGSALEALQMYVEGDARLDLPGFVFDFGVEQTMDGIYGSLSRGNVALESQLPSDVPFTRSAKLNTQLRDVRASIQEKGIEYGLSSELRSRFDPTRQRRVSELW